MGVSAEVSSEPAEVPEVMDKQAVAVATGAAPAPAPAPATASAIAPAPAPAPAPGKYEAVGVEGMCPYRLVLEHVTSRWGVLVLMELLERSYRFSELRRAIGRVSEKMLTQTLQTLERDGLVHRDAKPVIPPRVDYSLTDLGREAATQVWALAVWTAERMPDVDRARQTYDEARAEKARAQ